MPDTGAPWNIFYVAGSDLVSDWPTDNQTMAESVADALDVAKFAPIIAQRSTTFTTTSTSFTLVTDVEVDVTPATTSSTVLLIAAAPRCAIGAAGNVQGQIFANGVAIGPIGQAEVYTASAGNGFAIVWEHSPASTSLQNYEFRVKTTTGTASIHGATIMAQELR